MIWTSPKTHAHLTANRVSLKRRWQQVNGVFWNVTMPEHLVAYLIGANAIKES